MTSQVTKWLDLKTIANTLAHGLTCLWGLVTPVSHLYVFWAQTKLTNWTTNHNPSWMISLQVKAIKGCLRRWFSFPIWIISWKQTLTRIMRYVSLEKIFICVCVSNIDTLWIDWHLHFVNWHLLGKMIRFFLSEIWTIILVRTSEIQTNQLQTGLELVSNQFCSNLGCSNVRNPN